MARSSHPSRSAYERINCRNAAFSFGIRQAKTLKRRKIRGKVSDESGTKLELVANAVERCVRAQAGATLLHPAMVGIISTRVVDAT